MRCFKRMSVVGAFQRAGRSCAKLSRVSLSGILTGSLTGCLHLAEPVLDFAHPVQPRVPSRLQFDRHRAIVRIYSLVATSCQAGFVLGLFQLQRQCPPLLRPLLRNPRSASTAASIALPSTALRSSAATAWSGRNPPNEIHHATP